MARNDFELLAAAQRRGGNCTVGQALVGAGPLAIMNHTGRSEHPEEARVASSVGKEFRQIEWDSAVAEDCRQIVRLAVREDLDRLFDWTTVCLVPSGATAKAAIVSRQMGVVAGLRAAQLAASEMDSQIAITAAVDDGDTISAGQTLATIAGPARSLLSSERTLLNLVGRLSGIASLTRRYVTAIAHTQARIYDTRKTTPGWRRLEKYAVRCGGGHNHRTGLFDAILIKDNHLALGRRGAMAASSVRPPPSPEPASSSPAAPAVTRRQ